MLQKYSLYDESEMNQWDKFVESHPGGSSFHLSSWLKAIYETYSFEPLLYVEKNASDEICGLIPLFLIRTPFFGTRIVSLPFSDYGGPLCKSKMEEEKLMEEIIERHRDQVRYVEIRGPLSQKCNCACHDFYKQHVLTLLPEPPQVIKKIDKRTIQYSIRRAQKSGVQIREGNSQRDLEEFYRLNRLTRRKHGVPSQSLKFFENLLKNVVLSDRGYILLAFYDSKTVAGAFFLKFKETVIYKYNASDPDYLRSVTPNHLLTWHAIEGACLKGYRFFDFGRTSPDNVGLMRYKEMWGAKALDLPYYYYPRVKGATSKEGSGLSYRIYTRIWRSLPDTLVEFLGPKIIKYTA